MNSLINNISATIQDGEIVTMEHEIIRDLSNDSEGRFFCLKYPILRKM